MDTKQLSDILADRAMRKARDTLVRAANTYTSALRLSGTNFAIKLTEGDGMNMVTINTTTMKILDSITEQLLASRAEGIKAGAIEDFLSDFQSFKKNMLDLEQYAAGETE